MIANLLDGIEVRLNTDYLENKAALDALADKVVYTGPIDAYFDYKLGTLEYRSVRFENELLDKPSFQGNAAVNYTDRETPWTRIIEHKWFEFGKDENGRDIRVPSPGFKSGDPNYDGLKDSSLRSSSAPMPSSTRRSARSPAPGTPSPTTTSRRAIPMISSTRHRSGPPAPTTTSTRRRSTSSP